MKITLTNAGKRFNREWIFRHLSYEFYGGQSYAIVGPNGSGKSTLLQLLAGATSPSEGKLEYFHAQQSENKGLIPMVGDQPALLSENIYKTLSFSAPYQELIEEMTLTEFLDFHQVFKPFLAHYDTAGIVAVMGLQDAAHKQIRYFSSGMKQRVKLAQAIFSNTALLLLDEPCTNLDSEGVTLYQQLIADLSGSRLVIVSSNDLQEYSFCQTRMDMRNYKQGLTLTGNQ